ncbi:pirin family protein [Roseomonas eburnea]|uniref:Pirin family protein n=1 Tax=Neoroseomonas eburnea TaxID=1346889 RepID=A0A9X9X5T4_9PROT|nr:pirin family protein [Neoroseomonas eburnea]MBR0679070.1 pirin family protein [Neoroseomonas eburnea]
MSTLDEADPTCPEPPPGLEHVIIPRAHDVGGFEVRRALPAKERQMVGPFIFFDQMGPGEFLSGKGLDVRPHPHIGLSTVTYLFEGEILHRDSLGSAQPIRPGELNWMTAGRGIVHSERTDPAQRSQKRRMFGIQSWVALPKHAEGTTPGFAHHEAGELPLVDDQGVRMRLIAGEGWGLRAPVAVSSPLFYADAALSAGARLPLPEGHDERGAYVVEGSVEVAGTQFEAGRMLVFHAGDALALTAGPGGARLLMLGGAAMDGPRYLYWNFVASSRERLEQAKADWKAGRFPKVPGDEKEFIPLPEERIAVRAETRPA